MNISGLVITFNEEKHIVRCVNTLFTVCDEVIIIDSFSTDNTVAIAESLGAKVIQQKFLGDGPQRIFGIPYCKNDWILNVDADEFIDEDCYTFFKEKQFVNKPYDAYSFKRKNYLNDKEIKFADWYPDYASRFFNKKTASPSTNKVHQGVQATNMLKTNMHLIHYAWGSFYHIIAKKNQYTDWQVDEYLEKGKKVNKLSPVIHGSFSFFKSYILKKGIFHGIDGITFSLIQSFFSYMKYAKLIEAKRIKAKENSQ